jgi:hypothetical protein
MSLAEMRATLREMRKEHVKPVSRMKKGDISHEIEALRQRRETTPAAAATPSAPPKMMKPDVENIKDVKKVVFMTPGQNEMPTGEGKGKVTKSKPFDNKKPKGEKMTGATVKEAKMPSKKEMLMKMISEMSD